MTLELKLKNLEITKTHLKNAIIEIYEAGILHDLTMEINTNRFFILRENVRELITLIEGCEKVLRNAKPE